MSMDEYADMPELVGDLDPLAQDPGWTVVDNLRDTYRMRAAVKTVMNNQLYCARNTCIRMGNDFIAQARLRAIELVMHATFGQEEEEE